MQTLILSLMIALSGTAPVVDAKFKRTLIFSTQNLLRCASGSEIVDWTSQIEASNADLAEGNIELVPGNATFRNEIEGYRLRTLTANAEYERILREFERAVLQGNQSLPSDVRNIVIGYRTCASVRRCGTGRRLCRLQKRMKRPPC